jgi:hypothetical protein
MDNTQPDSFLLHSSVKWYRLIEIAMPSYAVAHNCGNDFSRFPLHFIEPVTDGINPFVIHKTWKTSTLRSVSREAATHKKEHFHPRDC